MGGCLRRMNREFIELASLSCSTTTAVIRADGSFCIDNGIMIAQAGLLAFRMGQTTPLEKTAVTQR